MGNRLKAFIQIMMFIIVLTACGNNIEQKAQNIEVEEQSLETLEETTSNSQLPIYDVSDVEAVVYYEGEPFIKSVFKTGGDILYIYGIKEDGTYFLGKMEKEEKILKEIPIDMQEDMQVVNMVVDFNGNCHMLWMSVEEIVVNNEKANRITFEKSVIIKINKDGKTEYSIDISEIISEKLIRPFCFLIDNEGNYYFENNSETSEIIKLCPDSSLAIYIPCDGEIEAIGCGKSGIVYCIYTKENGEEIIGKLEENRIVSCEASLPPANARYSSVAVGTDTELLLYNKDSGIYTYNSDTNVVEQRIQGNELPIYGQSVVGHGFLGDGRLCLLEQTEESTIFYYIPAGK